MVQYLRKKEKQGQISTKKDQQKISINVNKTIWNQLRQVCNGDLSNEMFNEQGD